MKFQSAWVNKSKLRKKQGKIEHSLLKKFNDPYLLQCKRISSLILTAFNYVSAATSAYLQAFSCDIGWLMI